MFENLNVCSFTETSNVCMLLLNMGGANTALPVASYVVEGCYVWTAICIAPLLVAKGTLKYLTKECKWFS